MVVWWTQASREERSMVSQLPTVSTFAGGRALVEEPYDPFVRDTLLASLFAAGSDLLLMPIQDVFGWSDRINEPATVNDLNWTTRLPWPIDRFDDVADARERRDQLRAWSVASGRA
jgi:4-alpha-glucanotransferase